MRVKEAASKEEIAMNVADLMELLKQHDPLMRVLVADVNSIFGALPDDLHVVEYSNAKALLIAPREFVESWDAGEAMTVTTDVCADLKSSHITAADGNVFADLGFPAHEAKALLADADAQFRASSMEQMMKADLQALAKMLLPLSDAEAEALAALDWLEREANLPDSIKAFFWEKLERAADAVLPEDEREPLRGCADVSVYRAAFNEHFARRRALREGGDEAH